MSQNDPVEGSIQWAMNRGTLFHVDGISQYGQLTTRAESPMDAARCIMYRCEEYCVWRPNGTELVVWNVYSGSIGGFVMKDPHRFMVLYGEVIPIVD